MILKGGGVAGAPDCPRALVIPSAIGGLAVTEIWPYAFYNKSLTAIIIPNTVGEIGGMALLLTRLLH